MQTGMVETWAGNITDIGPIYPFVGSEFVLWVIGMALWMLWHVWQARHESQEYQEDVRKYAKAENYKKMLGG